MNVSVSLKQEAAVSCFRQVVSGVSAQRHGLDTRLVNIGFVVEQVVVVASFTEFFGFPVWYQDKILYTFYACHRRYVS